MTKLGAKSIKLQFAEDEPHSLRHTAVSTSNSRKGSLIRLGVSSVFLSYSALKRETQ